MTHANLLGGIRKANFHSSELRPLTYYFFLAHSLARRKIQAQFKASTLLSCLTQVSFNLYFRIPCFKKQRIRKYKFLCEFLVELNSV